MVNGRHKWRPYKPRNKSRHICRDSIYAVRAPSPRKPIVIGGIPNGRHLWHPYKSRGWGTAVTNYPRRKSPRLQGYDYASNGVYFVTICTYQRAHLFGAVIDGVVKLTRLGELVDEHWLALSTHFRNIELDAHVVMPNHLHGIISLTVESTTLGTIISGYKAGVSRNWNKTQFDAERIWQSRYHDHIIRSEQTYQTIRQYVLCNPQRWEADVLR